MLILLYGNSDESRKVAISLSLKGIQSFITGRILPQQIRGYSDRKPIGIIVFPDSLEDDELEEGLKTLRCDFLGHILLLRRLAWGFSLEEVCRWGATDWIVDLQVSRRADLIEKGMSHLLTTRPFEDNAHPASRVVAALSAEGVGTMLTQLAQEIPKSQPTLIKGEKQLPADGMEKEFHGEPLFLREGHWHVLEYFRKHERTKLTPNHIARELNMPISVVFNKIRTIRNAIRRQLPDSRWRLRSTGDNHFVLDDAAEEVLLGALRPLSKADAA
ncbi:MAG: hypothetical protein ABI747_02535 [Candidatus Moraniibacteriota bacterium]